MTEMFNLLGWIACVVYCTIPSFWLLIHPWAEYWRSRRRSPYFALLPAWIGMWVVVGQATFRWREAVIFEALWPVWLRWIPAVFLFAAGFWLYAQATQGFSARQLGGMPEVIAGHREQKLVTIGIRARVRHPVYLAHLCEMLAWSVGTGLAVCWALTAFAIVTGAVMIRLEDAELEKRFGAEYVEYKKRVPAVWLRWGGSHEP